uniref:MEIS N-terminal domain-containing protein n=1 Tax=Gorilla gorilla gorilla TaxID=9595 RepID=A0A2I2Z5B1_GORGO
MMQHASPAPALTMMATQNVPPPPYQDSPQMTATAQPPSKAQAVHISAPSAAASTPVPSAPIDPQAQLEADKRAVYRHPLFPLLTLLFEKCEQATQGSECITSASFDVDIENFVHQQEQEHKPFFSDDPELDNLMVKAIQVLRIHLLELEKVNELCKDFCNRYITCLKTKMHSDNLLRNDLGGPYSPNQPSINLHSQDLLQNSPNSMSGVSNNPQGIVVPASALQQGNIAMTTVNSQVVSGGALYQPVTMVTSQGQVVTQAIPQGAIQIQNTQVNLDLTSLLDNEDKKSKNKRGVLPKHATNIMRSWLFQHLMVKRGSLRGVGGFWSRALPLPQPRSPCPSPMEECVDSARTPESSPLGEPSAVWWRWAPRLESWLLMSQLSSRTQHYFFHKLQQLLL